MRALKFQYLPTPDPGAVTHCPFVHVCVAEHAADVEQDDWANTALAHMSTVTMSIGHI
jgi:hypothetical protein